MKYKVIRKNCLNHNVGDIVELTEAKASALVGKVEPVKEATKPKAKQQKRAK